MCTSRKHSLQIFLLCIVFHDIVSCRNLCLYIYICWFFFSFGFLLSLDFGGWLQRVWRAVDSYHSHWFALQRIGKFTAVPGLVPWVRNSIQVSHAGGKDPATTIWTVTCCLPESAQEPDPNIEHRYFFMWDVSILIARIPASCLDFWTWRAETEWYTSRSILVLTDPECCCGLGGLLGLLWLWVALMKESH